MTLGELGCPDSNLLLFELCGRLCALPVEAVQEIVPMAALARSPGQPSFLEGFLNLRGTAVAVLRLDRLFGGPATPPGLYTPVVVLRAQRAFAERQVAVLVDRVLAIASVSAQVILPLESHTCFNDCATAQVALPGRTAHLLSAERLLLEKERQCVAEFESRAQQYLRELEGGRP